MPAIVLTTVRQSVIAEVASVVVDAVEIVGAVAVVVVVLVPELDAVAVVVDAVRVVAVVAGETPCITPPFATVRIGETAAGMNGKNSHRAGAFAAGASTP